MSYSNGLSFLESQTKVIELSNEFGARLVVCPLWNGRVMTCTCTGLEGDSYGFIDVGAIESRKNAREGDKKTAFSFGGENQLTLSPEGGPFDVYHDSDGPGHRSAPGFTEGAFDVDISDPSRAVRMHRVLSLTNFAGTRFDLNLIRQVQLLSESDLSEVFPGAAMVALEHPEVSFVSYKTVNTLVNIGSPFSRNGGLISIRLRNMLNATQFSTLVIPCRRGSEDELGPPVQADFFGVSSRKRLHLLPDVALFRTDGQLKSLVGVSRHRVLPYCAAIDFRAGVLTVISFNLPTNPAACDYMSNDFFETNDASLFDFVSARKYGFSNPAEKRYSGQTATPLTWKNNPYAGEVIRAYNHGPLLIKEEDPCPYFELDTFSPARELKKGESITHTQYTTHICADTKTLNYLAKAIDLQIDVSRAYETMLSQD